MAILRHPAKMQLVSFFGVPHQEPRTRKSHHTGVNSRARADIAGQYRKDTSALGETHTQTYTDTHQTIMASTIRHHLTSRFPSTTTPLCVKTALSALKTMEHASEHYLRPRQPRVRDVSSDATKQDVLSRPSCRKR